ncbi:hypothetical protein OIU84_029867 [Salix udensis]|uniref:Uncharacterized protein n=1 Tax=Salix udensis TaxID=889485 RepID=A0AAD6KAC1_9ROSI|nr:hypothetical protein OIU84_029867 [Salix udensis]
MVAVFNKEFLGWYFITLKLREAVGSAVAGAPMLEFPENHEDEETRSPDFEWVISIKNQIEQAGQEDEAGSWSKLSIYRVPHCLREVHDKAYVPQIISLGPYHHGEKHLRKMDKHKWRCLHHVMQRTNQDIKLYLDTAREMEAKARSCYEGPINLSSNEFVEMMVLDGCFMLELFQGVDEGFEELGYHRNDHVFAIRGSINFIMRDMIMLENQLPLFVLDRFLRLQLNNSYEKGLLEELALIFFYPLRPTPMTEGSILHSYSASFDPLSILGDLHCLDVFRKSLLRPGPKPRSVQGGLHCLHVFRKSLLRLWPKPRSVQGDHQSIHCVTELREAVYAYYRPRS